MQVESANHPDQPVQPVEPRNSDRVRPIEYGLVAIIASAVGIMAVPDLTPDLNSMAGVAKLTQLQYQIDAYRSSIEDYRADHHVYPGYEPGRKGAWLHGDPSGLAFKRQMMLWSDQWGQAGNLAPGRKELGPYLETGLPTNPINGLDSVRILPDDLAFPQAPTGETGWYFKPMTGELRANCSGDSVITGQAYYTL